VTCATGIIEIVMLLPGRMAAQVRRHASELLCRYLGGDLALNERVEISMFESFKLCYMS